MDKLYSKEQIEEWADKRADDAGRLARQLLDTMRENECLRSLAKFIHDSVVDSGALNTVLEHQRSKHPDHFVDANKMVDDSTKTLERDRI